MRETTLKIILIILFILAIPVFSYGANENLVIIRNTKNEYIMYMKEYLGQEFEFAFSNNKEADISTLTFNKSALDTSQEIANNIAYVTDTNIEMFENPTYMWVKVNGEIKGTAVEIDLRDNITKADLEKIETTSKIIPIKLMQKQIVNEVNEQGTKITKKIGIANILKEITNARYQLLKRETTSDTDKLFGLIEQIEENEFTDIYTKIKVSKEFIELYNKQYSNLNEKEWKTVIDLTIEQPIDSQTGDQYILWLKGDNVQDVHFLTSYRKYKEEFIKEEIKTKLPYTYDNNTILIFLGIIFSTIVLVVIRIIILKKKQIKTN